MIVYFDMDGVLTNMPLYVKKKTGLSFQELYDKGLYEKFMRHESPHMFSNLPDLIIPWLSLDELAKKLHDRGDQIGILTSLGRWNDEIDHGMQIAQNKQEWLKFNRPEIWLRVSKFRVVPHCEDKQYFADADSYLIDDKQSNVDEFIAAGGRATLFDKSDVCHRKLYSDLGFPIPDIIREYV